jgi:uncharacterized membrane protein YcaP (DUF421 family)
MWQLQVPPLELVARSVLVYLLFLVALRVAGKRELGQFTIFDLAAILLAANALQPAITGPDASVPGGLIIVTTLLTLNWGVAQARRRSRKVRRLLTPQATVIVRDGQWVQAAIDREGLDSEDLDAALREHGVGSVSEVELAELEQDGSISIVPKQGGSMRIATRRRRYRHRAPAAAP